MYAKLIAIAGLLWAGMILGISFLESWVKFRAPSLTRSVGLEVGRVVFRLFYKVQSAWIMLIFCLSLVAQLSFFDWIMLGVLVLIFSIQWLWLLPQLNNRVGIILTDGNPSPSFLHAGYGVAELTKLILLIVFSAKLIMLGH